MFIAGIGLSSYGLIGLIGLLIQIQKVNSNPYLRFANEDALVSMFIIDFIALLIGIMLVVFGVIKSKNKNALDKLINQEKNSVEQATCKSCGLNLATNTKICPRCGTQTVTEKKEASYGTDNR